MAEDDFEQDAGKAEEDQAWREAYEKTRKSLIERLGNWEDQRSWDDFYKRYWRLIYSVALKSGLRSEEALDVVQETILVIAKQQKEHRYDPKSGSFKSWLMNQTRWRIADQFRRRAKQHVHALLDMDPAQEQQRRHPVVGQVELRPRDRRPGRVSEAR